MRAHSLAKTRGAVALILCALAATQGAAAAEQVIACPAELPANTVKIEPPAGFVLHVASGLRLEGASFMSGPPESKEVFVPTASTKKGGKEITTWSELDGIDQKWMACIYGKDQIALAAQRVDPRAKKCTLTSTKDKFGVRSHDVRCSW